MTTSVTPNCPSCGKPPWLLLGGGTQAFCGTDDCRQVIWDPTMTAAELAAKTAYIDLGTGHVPPLTRP